MPCSDDRDYWTNKQRANSERHSVNALEARNTLLAQLLCYLMNNLTTETREFACKQNYDLKRWWDNHQEFDNKRKK